MGARLTSSNAVCIGALLFALRRLYTAIFDGPRRLRNGRSRRDSKFFGGRLFAGALGLQRIAGADLAIEGDGPGSRPDEAYQEWKVWHMTLRRQCQSTIK